MDNPQNNNQGIIMSGGTINSGQLAVGQNATNYQTNTPTDVLTNAFNELKTMIEQQIADEKQQSEILQALSTLVTELKQPEPNKIVGSALLEGLEKSVGHITSIAGKLAPFVLAAKVALGLP